MKKISSLLIVSIFTGYTITTAQELKYSNLNTKVEVDYELYKHRNDPTFKTSPYHPADISNSALWTQLITAVESGKAEAYTPDRSVKLTLNQVNKMLNRVDTLYIESPDPPYELQLKAIETKFNPNDIVEWDFIEDMVYNSKKNTLTKTVTYIIPVAQIIEPVRGTVVGKQPMMAIKMN